MSDETENEWASATPKEIAEALMESYKLTGTALTATRILEKREAALLAAERQKFIQELRAKEAALISEAQKLYPIGGMTQTLIDMKAEATFLRELASTLEKSFMA